MSMSNQHRRILEKITPDLLNDLDVEDVVPYLVADEVLTRNDVEKITSKSTSREKVAALMDIVPRRGAGAYASFLNSLMKTEGSTHLYQSIKYLEQEVPGEQQQEDQLPMAQECTDSISTAQIHDAAMLDMEGLARLNARQPAHPYRTLNDIDLLELSRGLGMHWEALALRLGLSRSQVYQCKEDNRYNQQQQTFDMLYKWKCKNGVRATVAALLDACRDMEELEETVYEFLFNL